VIQYEATMKSFLGPVALEAAKGDARSKFPNESCGFIAGGVYVACENKAKTPLTDFAIDDPRYDEAVKAGTLTAVIHSHPNGPIFPTQHDMEQQLATNVPWVIIMLNETTIGHTVIWGDQIAKAPLIGRPFVHGIFDCYSLIRDSFALGSSGMADQGVGWPLPPIELPQIPRDDNWWQKGEDLYVDHLKTQGFTTISRSEARPGDGFLIKLGDAVANPKKRLNHAGILVDHNLILHHLPGRNSRREPSGVWARAADLWVRYTGVAQ
jgi:proteasome lid subunit RPN8/RPN11